MGDNRDKVGSKLDEELKKEAESLERSGKEPHVEEFREKQGDTDKKKSSGHRISGSGSSAGSYTYDDKGEEGGASHPKPGKRRKGGDQ
jgi:hypothetical protein